MHEEIVEGEVLAGKYRVERVLGVGGMGIVVSAHHLHLDQRVAIKFMLREALGNGEAVARFSREARAAVRIKSEHVARVSDVGVLDNGAPYMVMEYLEGKDLSGWLQQHGQLPVEHAVEFILQASEAIAEAHSLGIVHRDLKPANLFVIRRPDGALSVKVLDFGISKVTGLAGSGPDFGMTKTSAVMGSPLYMSPEQMRSSRDADARSDIWALGVILHELLTGAAPFIAEGLPDLVLKISIDAPESLRGRAPHVPRELEAVILRCLEKDPRRRFANVAELAVALADFAPVRSRLSIDRISGVLGTTGLSASAPIPALTVPSSTAAPQDATAASWGQTAASRSGGKRALLVTGALVSVAALALAGYGYRRPSASPTASAEASPAAAAVVPPVSSLARSAPPQVMPLPIPVAPALAATAAAPEPAVSRPPTPVSARASSAASASRADVITHARSSAPIKVGIAGWAARPQVALSPAVAATGPAVKPKPAATNNVFDER